MQIRRVIFPMGNKIPYSLFAPREHMSQSKLVRPLEKRLFVGHLLNETCQVMKSSLSSFCVSQEVYVVRCGFWKEVFTCLGFIKSHFLTITLISGVR